MIVQKSYVFFWHIVLRAFLCISFYVINYVINRKSQALLSGFQDNAGKLKTP